MPFTTPPTGGETQRFSPSAGQWRPGVISEKVIGPGASGYLQLTQTIPANSRIVWCTLNNRVAITPLISSTAAQTTAGQLGVALIVGTALPSMAGALNTTSNYLLGQIQTAAAGAIAANSIARGLAVIAATGGGVAQTNQYRGIGTAAVNVYVLPYLSTTAATATGSYYVNTTATIGTLQYTLNGTVTATAAAGTSTNAEFDVQVFFETFIDTPNA